MTGVTDGLLRKLTEFYGQDESARAVLDHLAGRERNRGATSVDSLLVGIKKDGRDISRAEVIRVLRSLDAFGCGKFLVGRKNNKSRFQWDVGLVSVGQVAVGETEEIVYEVPEEGDDMDVDIIKHQFQLRTDEAITIELPANLTETEAQRLAAFVKSLPFG